jgi:hypothetical protein
VQSSFSPCLFFRLIDCLGRLPRWQQRIREGWCHWSSLSLEVIPNDCRWSFKEDFVVPLLCYFYCSLFFLIFSLFFLFIMPLPFIGFLAWNLILIFLG